MNLKHLTDTELLKDTKRLVKNEREITTEILHHIKEVSRRKLYSDLKYPSLFEYCIKELKYSEASAHRRIEGSKLLADIPQIESKIEDGTLNLTILSKVAMFIKENEIVATEEKKKILNQVEKLTTRECEKKLNSLSQIPQDRKIRLSILEKTHDDLLNVRNLMGRNFSMDHLIDVLIQNTKAKITKDKFKQNSSVRKSPALKAVRVISASVKREVYQRDKKCVQCGTTHHLNYDHRKPFSLGGASSADNIRLLCFNCNQRSRIKAKL